MVDKITSPITPNEQANKINEIIDAIPSVGNGTITITQGGTTKGSFTTNQSGNATIALDAGGGSTTTVKINGTSITSSGVADIKTYGTYNSSSNKIATMNDLPTVPTNVSSFTNDSGYITGINSTDVTTALGYTPTSPANVDGQWVASSQDFTVSTSVTSSPQEFNLKTLNYLPNDNNKYEVLVWLDVTVGSSSSSAVYLSSDIVSGNCVSVQTNVSKYGNMNFAIPVNSTLKVQVKLAAVNRVNFTALGYRRIGTNS